MVVKPPRHPAARNTRQEALHSPEIARLISSPMRNDPAKFTTSVPKGNAVPNRDAIATPAQ